jgi:hypothetical protein
MTVLSPRRLVRPGSRRVRRSHPIVVEDPQLAGRTPLASFSRYAAAEHTIDLLTDTRFPVHRLALVGGDLKLVEEVTGRFTAARAAWWGACAGAWLGALMAVFAIVVERPAFGEIMVLLSWGILLGALFGAALTVTAYAGLGRTRDFTSHRHLVAARYELYVDADVAASAWRLLIKLHPAGMTLVDRVPVEVVAVPTDLTLIETFEPMEAGADAA